MRTLLLVAALTAAQAVAALAQAPPTGPTTAPTTQPAATAPRQAAPRPTTQPAVTQPRATTQPAVTQPKPPPKKAAPTKGEPLPHKPASPAAEREAAGAGLKPEEAGPPTTGGHAAPTLDFWSMVFVFMLATFIGLGVIRRVSRLLHTPLMSLTNAISAIAVVGSIVLAGGKHYPNNWYHFWGAVALFASMTNIVSGFLITDRMLKMFKTREGAK